MAHHREKLVGAVLLSKGALVRRDFKIMFAPQNPIFVGFSEVSEIPQYVPWQIEEEGEGDDIHWRRKFKLDYLSFLPWNELPFQLASDYELLFDVHYLGNKELGSNDLGQDFHTYLSTLPAFKRQENTTATKPKTKIADPVKARILELYPWLAGFFEEEEKKKSRGGGRGNGHGEKGNDDEVVVDEDALMEALMSYAEAKEEYDVEDDTFDYWRVKTLGGKWTKLHKNVAFDAFRGAPPANSDAMQFAVKYKLQGAARFDVKPYTVAGAHLLVRTYCAKCEHFFKIYQSAHKKNYKFTQDDYDSWVHPEDFLELRARMTGREKGQVQLALQLVTSLAGNRS